MDTSENQGNENHTSGNRGLTNEFEENLPSVTASLGINLNAGFLEGKTKSITTALFTSGRGERKNVLGRGKFSKFRDCLHPTQLK